MKLRPRSVFAQVLFSLGLTLTSVNLLFLIFSDSIRDSVGDTTLIALGVGGLCVMVASACFDSFPYGGTSQHQ